MGLSQEGLNNVGRPHHDVFTTAVFLLAFGSVASVEGLASFVNCQILGLKFRERRCATGVSSLPSAFRRDDVGPESFDSSKHAVPREQSQGSRTMNDLQTWALERGVRFSSFAELYRADEGCCKGNNDGDGNNWGVRLTMDAMNQLPAEMLLENHVHNVNTKEPPLSSIELMAIPADIVLTSERPLFSRLIAKSNQSGQTNNILGSASGLEQYAREQWERQVTAREEDIEFRRFWPEFVLLMNLLILRLQSSSPSICENTKDDDDWRPWLDSLPLQFDTGLYWGETQSETHSTSNLMLAYALQFPCLRRFWHYQQDQYRIMSQVAKDILKDTNLHEGTDADVNSLVQWAYSIVFSRSWRYVPENRALGEHAMIVPMADMFNHYSASAYSVDNGKGDSMVNMVRVQLPDSVIDGDGMIKVLWKPKEHNLQSSSHSPKPSHLLHLNYGFIEHPARFLVVFGFLDQSTPVLSANITWDLFEGDDDMIVVTEMVRDMGLDQLSHLVFYTCDGSVSDMVWDAILFQVLLEQRSVSLNQNPKAIRDDTNDKDDWQIFYNAKCTLAQTQKGQEDSNFSQSTEQAAAADEIVLQLHVKWELPVALALQQHVGSLLESYRGVQPPLLLDVDNVDGRHNARRCLSMLVNYQSFMCQILERASAHATRAVAEAKARL